MQNIRSVKEEVEQQQRPDEAEVRVADKGEQQGSISTHAAHPVNQVADEVRAEFLHRVGRRDARNAQAGGQPNERQHDQQQTRPALVATEVLGH